ncbi:MAG: 16S rRNA (guanine(966)-N(2))-methyltransferase RsmD [Anaerolineae bacterium]
MRIIGGRFRGRRLAAVSGPVRPTADRVREAIFNILGERVQGATVLDLYAGTGALGLEALSRGAAQVVFVEQHHQVRHLLQRNLTALGVADQARLVAGRVLPTLPQLARGGQRFDLVFLDPPYGLGLAAATLKVLAAHNLVKTGGLVVVECHRTEELAPAYPPLHRCDCRTYGTTSISLYQSATDDERDSYG